MIKDEDCICNTSERQPLQKMGNWQKVCFHKITVTLAVIYLCFKGFRRIYQHCEGHQLGPVGCVSTEIPSGQRPDWSVTPVRREPLLEGGPPAGADLPASEPLEHGASALQINARVDWEELELQPGGEKNALSARRTRGKR